ncbi:MAG: WGR domain-containing protein [Bacteroidales bacterium]|nr:WGR domain-containing protein [Bacteroidales bacterium]MCM1147916.1 WGR domain-containing protein [Bacteroidales bacterium]MCM1205465.1 WGR domain-containing protein [Bacillota bacterium]MCM1509273.1 WGR domain-containing protein [Clostridium sp.]
MKRGFIYKNEKTSKFWWIDYGECCFAVGYGKCGSVGTFLVKEFGTEEECRKEAEKLVRSKIRKGYVEDDDFDFVNRLYIDNYDFGLSPKTSNPRFVEHFTDELYYSEYEEFGPFGSDEGSDTLAAIYGRIRKNPDFDFESFPRKFVEDSCGMKYIPAGSIDAEKLKELAPGRNVCAEGGTILPEDMKRMAANMVETLRMLENDSFPKERVEEEIDITLAQMGVSRDELLDYKSDGNGDADVMTEMDVVQSDIVTYATAFAQIKITGSVSAGLKEHGINAIKELSLIDGLPWTEDEVRTRMVEDLQSFSFTV